MRNEPSQQQDMWAREVIGAAIEVHRTLGPGYLEASYESALAVEFDLRDIPYLRQEPIRLTYKGHSIGDGRMDFLVGGVLVVELKAVERLEGIHHAQVIAYLKATGHTLGLLINFNTVLLRDGIKRVVLSDNI